MPKNYAEKWNKSSEFFYKKGYYTWMCDHINDYHTILEIGCGAGYGTLSLAKAGHEIITIDKDRDCISLTKKLINDNRLDDRVTYVEQDIIINSCVNYAFDAMVCWNPAVGNTNNQTEYDKYMLKYGLTLDQIHNNLESSYAEYFIWHISKLSKKKGVPFHLIDRWIKTDDLQIEKYYSDIKDEIGFSKIEIDHLEGESLSEAGVPLIVKGNIISGNVVPNLLVSVLMM